MNQDIRILYEDEKFIYISWKKDDISSKYVIVGMDNLFNYNNILRTNKTYAKLKKKDVIKYLNIRVDYLLSNSDLNRDVLIGSSNSLTVTDRSFEKIEVKCLKSYEGFTVSFISDLIYDKYYVYEKVGENYNLILETEDFQVTSKKIKANQCYCAEGYKKSGSGYELTGKSGDFVCKSVKLSNSVDKKLSVVIPVYNSEKFLCRCVDSILLSSFKDLELIIIDDGSFDNSSHIIDWYKDKYGSLIKVIHKKNEGLSFARNDGIKLASGEYIAFADSDDIIHPFMYERLYSCASHNNLDIAIGKALIRKDINEYNFCLDVQKDSDFIIYDYEKMLTEKLDNTVNNIFFVAVWNKIIRTSIVKEHPFPLENYYEDSAFTPMIYSYIDKFGFVKNAYYVWDKRQRKTVGTLSSTYNHDDSMFLHRKYCEALFYPIKYGNKKRLDYLTYDIIRNVYKYLKKMDREKPGNSIYDIYKEAILMANKRCDLRNNPYLSVDKELYEFVINVIK